MGHLVRPSANEVVDSIQNFCARPVTALGAGSLAWRGPEPLPLDQFEVRLEQFFDASVLPTPYLRETPYAASWPRLTFFPNESPLWSIPVDERHYDTESPEARTEIAVSGGILALFSEQLIAPLLQDSTRTGRQNLLELFDEDDVKIIYESAMDFGSVVTMPATQVLPTIEEFLS